jgi:tetratricopeptide (TPR) repeat protein
LDSGTVLFRHLIAAGLLGILVLILYSGSTGNGFVWDDHQQILANPELLASSPWTRVFSTSVWSFEHPGERAQYNQYRPLQMLTYRLTGQSSGFDARWFHWVSLLFHFAASVLFYLVVYQLTGRFGAAAAAACLFVAHPIHTEAVDWIASLADLGCAVFFLLSFLLYLKSERAASWISFGLALLWKEMAVTLPLVIAAHMMLCRRRGKRDVFRLTFPYWMVFAIYLLLRFHALGTLYTRQQDWRIAPFPYALTDAHLVAMYWWKLIWPLPLMGYHVFAPVTSLAEPRVWVAILFLLALIAAGVYRYRSHPLATFAIAWVFLTLAPVLNLNALGRNVFAERYLYIPSAGFCLLAVWLAEKAAGNRSWLGGRWLGGIGLAAVVLFYGAETMARGADWKDNETFFSRSLEQSGNSAFLHNAVAEMLRTKGDSKLAEAHYARALALAGEWNPPEKVPISVADVGLAYVLAQSGEFDGALRDLDLAAEADPLNGEIAVARGSILTQAGRWDPAKKAVQEVLAKNPDNEVAVSAMGIVAWQGDHDSPLAIEYLERALSLPSSDLAKSSIHENLGAIYCGMERCGEGISHFETAVQLNPGNPRYYVNLGMALRTSGRSAEAREQFLRALKIAPGYQPARYELEH